MDGRLDRSADVLVDQFAERDRLKLMRADWLADTFAHGVFLRRPPWQAACWSCTSPTGRMRHFSFPPEPGHDPKPGFGSIRIIDQVKAYGPGHKVSANDVRALLGVLALDLNVSKGIVTTTSTFAPGVEDEIKPYMPNRLELKDGAR
jgi:hypothetical protein